MSQSFRDFVLQMQESCKGKMNETHAPISHIEDRIKAVRKEPQTPQTQKTLETLRKQLQAAKQKEILDAPDDDFRHD